MRRKRKVGFTLIELMVVISIIGLLVAILVPALTMVQKLAKQANCAANLSNIGKTGISVYNNANNSWPFISNDSNGAYVYDAAMVAPVDSNIWGLVTKGAGGHANMNENLCLLMKERNVASWRVFLCPATHTTEWSSRPTDANGYPYYGFKGDANDGGKVHIDYAMQLGYANTRDANVNSAQLNDNLDGSVVVLGDKPSDLTLTEFSKAAPSDTNAKNDGTNCNHGSDGINVITASLSVSWSKAAKCGYNKNNVWTMDMAVTSGALVPAATTAVTPVYSYDTVLIRPQ